MLKRLMNYNIQDSPNPIWFKRGRKNNYFENVQKTFMGRDSLNALLYNISKKSVLLPAYICDEVTEEFNKYEYEIYYYDLREDFTIDIDDIKQKIKKHEIDVFYYVIYFGFFSKYNLVAEQIKRETPNTLIIEDRAHYLSNEFDYENCDAYIFSFRKALPIPDGGGVATNLDIELEYKDKILANILPFAMVIKKLMFGYSNRIKRNNVIKDTTTDKVKPISILSKNVIARTNYDEEKKIRITLYKKWINKLKEFNIEPEFDDLTDVDIPLGCPIRVDDAELVQKTLSKKGYYLKRHWPLEDDIKCITPTSYRKSKMIVTLPIYKGIKERDQVNILQLIKSCNVEP